MGYKSEVPSHHLLLGVDDFARVAHRTQETFFLPDYPVKNITQEQPDGRDGEDEVLRKGVGFHALHGGAAPHKSPHVHQPGSSLNPVLLGFYGDYVA